MENDFVEICLFFEKVFVKVNVLVDEYKIIIIEMNVLIESFKEKFEVEILFVMDFVEEKEIIIRKMETR